MDRIRNPFAPGAGSPPPELAGRTQILDDCEVAMKRSQLGKPSRSFVLVGLRGVGKTVLLRQISRQAAEIGLLAPFTEAHDGKPLARLLAPGLKQALYQLSRSENAKLQARRGLSVLRSFLSSVKVSIGEIDIGLSIDPEPGRADSGDLELDLPDLIEAVGEAARAAGKGLTIFVDEVQYLSPQEFGALIMAVHRTNQQSLPVLLIAAGLPQVLALAGNSKSYAERLFDYPRIGALSESDAAEAIRNPVEEEGAGIDEAAVAGILSHTERYPYFLQQWGYEAWNVASDDRITAADVERAVPLATQALDEGFFRVRFERCTPKEKEYLRALAELGSGKQRSGEVAELLGVKVNSIAPRRDSLVKKGMLYAPAHGDTAFTVPMFDAYMRRVMPCFPAENRG